MSLNRICDLAIKNRPLNKGGGFRRGGGGGKDGGTL